MKSKKIKYLRKKYPEFIYQSFQYNLFRNELRIKFDFSASPDIHFTPELNIKNVDRVRINLIPTQVLDNLIFHLGLIELISYWKCVCSPVIRINPRFLNKEQTGWWKNLIKKGMGQFFYENQIDFRYPEFITILSSPKKTKIEKASYSLGLKNTKVLIPIGGGKDSIVTSELLKKSKRELNYFSLNSTDTTRELIKCFNSKNPIIVNRKIDKKLLDLNRKGFLNGHTPFSAYLAFLGVLLSTMFDYKYIALSNERSSNYGNLEYLGNEINHQYSKSFEFEEGFREYSKKYLINNIEYFSFLRPLYEIQITKLFSRYPKYFPIFLSCNHAYQTNSGTRKVTKKWCGKCPKCLFVFTCLYPFVKEKEIIKIFKENLFEKKELLPLVKELIGKKGTKPFECVGTQEESLIAFYLSLQKIKKTKKDIPVVLKYIDNITSQDIELKRKAFQIMNSWDKRHNIPKGLENILKNEIR